MIGNTGDLQTENKDSIVDAINEVFQNVSDGKELIANAITDKGVETLATGTFTEMANNIGNISTMKDVLVDGLPIGKEFELKYKGYNWISNSISTLPYSFYNGSAVVYNNEIHILGSSNSGNYTKHYKGFDMYNMITKQ